MWGESTLVCVWGERAEEQRPQESGLCGFSHGVPAIQRHECSRGGETPEHEDSRSPGPQPQRPPKGRSRLPSQSRWMRTKTAEKQGLLGASSAG